MTPAMPKHRRIAADMRVQIGDMAPGDPVPSEQKLMGVYAVSRETVRKVLAVLEREGLIYSSGAGLPRRVSEHNPVTLRVSDEESLTFIQDLVAAGHTTAAPRITVKIEGDRLVREVLREVDGEPHNWARWTFPLELAQGTRLAYDVDIAEGSVKYVKEGLGCAGLTQEKWIEARMPTPQETAVLKMTGGPVIVEHRTGSVWRPDGTARQLFRSVRILRADRTRLIP